MTPEQAEAVAVRVLESNPELEKTWKSWRDVVKEKFLEEIADPEDPRHGTNLAYQKGCRCGLCLVARRDYLNGQKKRKLDLMIEDGVITSDLMPSDIAFQLFLDGVSLDQIKVDFKTELERRLFRAALRRKELAMAGSAMVSGQDGSAQ